MNYKYLLLILVSLLIANCGGDLNKSMPERNLAEMKQPREYAARGGKEAEVREAPSIFANLLSLTQLGYIHYPGKRDMTQGESEILYTEIFMRKPEFTPYGLVEDIVHVSRVVCVDLVGHDDAFSIIRMGERCQLVVYPSSTWKWSVLPLLSGKHNLELVVINKLEVGGEEAVRNELTKTATVKVDVSVKYMVTNFFRVHWKWFVATIGTVFAYFFNKKRKSKKNS